MARPLSIPASEHADLYDLWKATKPTNRQLAEIYGVSHTIVWRVIQREAIRRGEDTGARTFNVKPKSIVVHHPDAPEGVAYIQTSSGDMITVDQDMLPVLSKYSWSVNGEGYAMAYSQTERQRVYMHRVILPDAAMVDHRNGRRLDCRKENLRPCNRTQNLANSPPRGKLGLKGVSVTRSGRFSARIKPGGELKVLGTFDTAVEAARAYDAAAKEAFGEFAWLNNI